MVACGVMDATSGIMTSSEEKRVDDGDARRFAASEANRVRLQNKYATDPEYRERVKAANRENAAKRRARGLCHPPSTPRTVVFTWDPWSSFGKL